jgi:hypothetical protein
MNKITIAKLRKQLEHPKYTISSIVPLFEHYNNKLYQINIKPYNDNQIYDIIIDASIITEAKEALLKLSILNK